MMCNVADSFVMYNVKIILVINLIACKKALNDGTNGLESRIIGGVPVPMEKYPSTVKFYNVGAMCAGTILNSWSVLTAAHCFDYNKEIYEMIIEVGARYIKNETGDLYGVLKFVIYNDYNKLMPFACDLALIFVTEAIKLGNKAKKALLVNDQSWMSPTVNNIVVSGWGWTKYGGPISESGLMETHLRYVTSEECERLHQLQLSPDMFCLYGDGERDTCKGDSGGGVMWNNMVIGVVSHGDGCAKKDKPSVYTNVWYFRGWIETQMEYFFQNACQLLEAHEQSSSPNLKL